MSNMISYQSLASSNLPVRQKSAIARMVERMGGGGAAMSRVKAHAMATGNAVRQGGESVVVGAALGFAHVELPNGLDVKVPGQPNVKLPVDGIGGAACMIAGVALAHEEFGKDLTNAGAAAVSIFAFRKTAEFAAKKKAERGGGLPGGRIAGEGYEFGAESENDRIIALARSLR